MVSNEERRKIAARLRSVTNEEYRMCFLEEILTGCVGAAYVYDSECQLDVRLMVNRLANLIEPEPERTCKNNDGFCSECGQKLVEYAKKVSVDDEQNITMTFAVQPYCCRCGAKVQS